MISINWKYYAILASSFLTSCRTVLKSAHSNQKRCLSHHRGRHSYFTDVFSLSHPLLHQNQPSFLSHTSISFQKPKYTLHPRERAFSSDRIHPFWTAASAVYQALPMKAQIQFYSVFLNIKHDILSLAFIIRSQTIICGVTSFAALGFFWYASSLVIASLSILPVNLLPLTAMLTVLFSISSCKNRAPFLWKQKTPSNHH